MKYKNNIEFVNEYLESSEWFLFREMKVTTLTTLLKQSRKKGSFHSISEVKHCTQENSLWIRTKNCRCQILRHFPQLAHVLVINELDEFWDNFQ
jgi:hypothetical protein